MKLLEDKIRACGTVAPGGVLKVGGFLNHRLDVDFLDKLADEFYRLFRGEGVTEILTVEASGIAVATLTALKFHVPAVFAKKSETVNLSGECFTADVESFTHKKTYQIRVEKAFLTPAERVLIIDDFLAMGSALRGLSSLVAEAGATLVGAGVVIEKAFQPGGQALRDAGVRVESLAKVARMTDGGEIEFEE